MMCSRKSERVASPAAFVEPPRCVTTRTLWDCGEGHTHGSAKSRVNSLDEYPSKSTRARNEEAIFNTIFILFLSFPNLLAHTSRL